MKLDWLLTGWNAVYTLPLALVMVLLAVSALLGLAGDLWDGLGHADANAHHEADVHHEADAGAEHDADADHDAEHEAEAHSGLGAALLGLIGFGHMPVVMLVEVLLLLWGVIGLALHHAFGASGPAALLWSVPATLLLSAAGTGLFARTFGRCFRPYETAALRRDQLTGRTGRVVYPVTESEGTVHVRDQYGTLHRVRARTRHERLEPGQEIVILGYDPERKLYEVDEVSAFLHRD